MQVRGGQARAERQPRADQAPVHLDLVAADEQAQVGHAHAVQALGGEQGAVEQRRDAGQQVLGGLPVAGRARSGEQLRAPTPPHHAAPQGEGQSVGVGEVAHHRRDLGQAVAVHAVQQRGQDVGALGAAVVVRAPHEVRAGGQRVQHAQCEAARAAEVVLGADVRGLDRLRLDELAYGVLVGVVHHHQVVDRAGLAAHDGQGLAQLLEPAVGDHDGHDPAGVGRFSARVSRGGPALSSHDASCRCTRRSSGRPRGPRRR